MMAATRRTTQWDEEQLALGFPPGIENHYWYLGRNWILRQVLKKHGVAGNTRLLDVGCGRGVTVDYLRRCGFSCDGVELSVTHVLESVVEFVAVGKQAQELDAENRLNFEVLLLLDVLEHIQDVKVWLQELLGGFPNAEHLVVTVPANPCLWTNYDEFVGHFRRYRLEDLSAVAEDVGWEAVELRYFSRVLYLPLRLLAILGINRPLGFHAPSRLELGLHRILAATMFVDYRIVSRRIRGTSILGWFSRRARPTVGRDLD